MSPLSQVHAPPLCPAAHPLLLGGEGGAWEEEPRRPLSVSSSQDLSHLPSSWALPFGAPAWGWHPRLEKRTQGSLFQPRRQRAPLSTPGPSPHWVSVCEGVEPVWRGRRGGRTTEDRSSRTAPGATFAASSACPEPAPRLTVSILPHLPCSLPWPAWGRGGFSRAPGDRGRWHGSALRV